MQRHLWIVKFGMMQDLTVNSYSYKEVHALRLCHYVPIEQWSCLLWLWVSGLSSLSLITDISSRSHLIHWSISWMYTPTFLDCNIHKCFGSTNLLWKNYNRPVRLIERGLVFRCHTHDKMWTLVSIGTYFSKQGVSFENLQLSERMFWNWTEQCLNIRKFIGIKVTCLANVKYYVNPIHAFR